MPTDVAVSSNVKQAVPFFNVTDIEASLRFYVNGLGCVVTNQWLPEGRVRWCWLQFGDAALMLQEYWRDTSAHRTSILISPTVIDVVGQKPIPPRTTETLRHRGKQT